MLRNPLITAIIINVIGWSADAILPCKFINTINITGGYEDIHHNFIYQGDVYPLGTYEEYKYVEDFEGLKTNVDPHIRTCGCASKACIRICCSVNDKNCERPQSVEVTNINHEYEIIDLSENKYGILIGRPCRQMFRLEPDDYQDDKWNFLSNGSILQDQMVFGTDDYCFEVTNASETRLHLCFTETPTDVRFKVYPIGMLISIPFLIITFLIYACIPELRNLHGKCLMCYIVALTILYASLSIVQTSTFDISIGEFSCFALGYLIYFAILLTFFWMNVMCYDIWTIACSGIAHRSFQEDIKTFFKYCLYAFGLPLLMTMLAYLIDSFNLFDYEYAPSIGDRRCYIGNDFKVEAIYVYIPISIIVCVNIMFFIDTAHKIWKVQSTSNDGNSERSRKHLRRRFRIYLRLFIVMGVTWCMEVISWFFKEKHFVFYISDGFNCIQGLWIFIVCVCDIKTLRLISKRCCSSNVSADDTESYAGEFAVSETK